MKCLNVVENKNQFLDYLDDAAKKMKIRLEGKRLKKVVSGTMETFKHFNALSPASFPFFPFFFTYILFNDIKYRWNKSG